MCENKLFHVVFFMNFLVNYVLISLAVSLYLYFEFRENIDTETKPHLPLLCKED